MTQDATRVEPHVRHADEQRRREGMPSVPGYTLDRILGRGGMGIVWSALEHRLDRRVALKVQAASRAPERVAQMWSEARLAAKVADPGIVPVHDFGYTTDGDPFYTMDLVEGTDLRALLKEAPLPRVRALELAAQIASAVGAAHARGIVHRDLKPSNVLVDTSGRARVLDFGLAFDPALGDAYANLVAGTPAYMAPEQIAGGAIGPAADVHAVGVMLYQMPTGTRPWHAEGYDILQLIARDPAEPPSVRNPAVASDVEELCLRCLAKSPEERFPNGRALADALDALRLGMPLPAPISLRSVRVSRPAEPASTTSPPPSTDRPERDSAPVHLAWTWTLRASPEALWPYVSNTDRVNKAIGLEPVLFHDEPDAEAGSTRFGSYHVLGMTVRWREYPFEWVAPREHAVFRRYDRGPLQALWNRVRLEPAAGGGTQLTHEIWIEPRGVLGRLATFVEVDRKMGHNLDRLYRRIDAHVAEGKGADPFEELCKPSASQRRQVESAARRLVERGFDPELVSRLSLFVMCEPAKRLERMRPFEMADAWRVDREGMLELLLHAAYAGLLELSWDAICPRCRIAHESFEHLDRLSPASRCVPCGTEYERDLAESVEIVFRPHPDVRRAAPSTYCVGAPALRPHVLAQQRVAPGETHVVKLDLAPGDYVVALDWPQRAYEVWASASGFLSVCDVDIRDDALDVRPAVVLAGAVELRIRNDTKGEQVVRVERAGGRADTVTAAMVMTRPSFRELFSEELLAEHQPVSVRRMAFAFLDLEKRSRLFAERGDAAAWAAMRRLDDIVADALRAHPGMVVPAPLGVYAMAFGAAEDAFEAARAVLEAWSKEQSPAQATTPLRAAIHEGPCIAVTREHRIEYFGRNVHRAYALLDDAPASGIALSDPVASDRGVARRIRESGLAFEVGRSVESGPHEGARIARLVIGKQEG
jgi:eukaryotic-like serine/threonine-protein kinase